MKDFYYILGVDPNCSFKEIQSAYTKLSGKFNPELNNGDKYFKSRFQEINEAYNTLGNPHNRQQYDQQLNAFYNGPDQIIVTPPGFRGSRMGIGMTIALIVLALVVGDYILQYFKKADTTKTTEVYAETVQPDTIQKKHKRHHLLKNRMASDSVSHHNNLSRVKLANSPAVYRPVVAKYAKLKSLKDSSKKLTVGQYNNGVLYTTYVNPNATGVVNLRTQDAYSSPVFATIPANSKVAVLERGDVYYKISFFKYTGYVPKWSLQIK